jgi:hypothetical protein
MGKLFAKNYAITALIMGHKKHFNFKFIFRISMLHAILICCNLECFAQIEIQNYSPLLETFDEIGSSLNLPANWRMAASTSVPLWSSAVNAVIKQSSTGSPITGATYNWGSSTAERAVGAMSSGSFPSPSSLLGFYVNKTSGDLTGLIISFDVERYRINASPASVEFYYSLDGIEWIGVPYGNISSENFPTGNSSYGYPINTISKTGILITALTIAPESSFYLRWNINTTGSNSQGIGIDNISVAAMFASLTDYFRSNVPNGDWQSVSSWQSSHDNSNWFPATVIPGNSAAGITIRNGHTIKLAANVSARLLTVEAGGTLTNTNVSGGNLLTVEDDGTAISDFNIYGTYVLFGKPPQFNIGATATVFQNALVRADENAGSESFALSPNVYFKTAAVFEWNNTNAFNTKKVIYFPNSINDVPIFRISKTTPIIGTTDSTTFNGLLEINANISFGEKGPKVLRDGIFGSGTLILEASSASKTFFTSTNAIISGSLKLVVNDILHFANGVIIPSGADVKVTGSGSFRNHAGDFKIDGILDISDVKITLTSPNLILNGTVKTSKSTGFFNPGNIASGIITINDGCTIEYNGSDQDITSTTVLKSKYYNIIFSGTGIKTPKSGIDVHTNGSVKITGDAIVDASSKNIGLSGSDNTAFVMDGGRLILGTSSNEALPLMDGLYNITGGVIEYSSLDGSVTETIKTQSYQNIEVTGTNVKNSSGNITLNANGTFTVKSGGSFEINANSITCPAGGGKVVVENNATFKTGNNQGFNGFTTNDAFNYSSIHANITNIQLSEGSTVEYSRNDNQPITSANKLIYGNIFISGSGEKTAPSGDLLINGNIIKSGLSTFKHNGGTVVLNGSSQQNISGNFILFNNLTNKNSNAISISNDIGIDQTLFLDANSKLILDAGDIHLKAGLNHTANVAGIPNSASIIYNSGRFIVETYIPGHPKAWQLLAAPTKGQTINQAWQEGNLPTLNIKPGYGTQITSNLPNPTALGFDMYSVSPSMKTYDPLKNDWIGVSNTKDLMINNPYGYMIFIRGDRSVTKADQPAVAVILRSKGKLYAPGVEAPSSINIVANTFAPIGNPYASAIDFNAIIKTPGIDNSYYIWDAQLTSSDYSSFGYGGYRTISGNSVVPATGKYADEDNLPFIQSGQAFFVHASADGIVSFDENCKANSSTTIFRPASGLLKADAQLRINLFRDNNTITTPVDGTLTQFHSSYTNEIDGWDAKKISNSNENLFIINAGNKISIERRAKPQMADTIFLNLSNLTQQKYRFEIISGKLERYGMEAFLHDNFLQSSTPLNLSGINNISFLVNSRDGSSASNRFYIFFKAAGGPLPVTISSLKAFKRLNNITVEWEVENETDISNYVIEKSIDGITFVLASIETSQNNSSAIYSWLDENPFSGNNYYRLKIVSINGKYTYSKTVHVRNEETTNNIFVYPNPLAGKELRISIAEEETGKYVFKMTNAIGQTMIYEEINHKSKTPFEAISLPANLPRGIYQLEVISPSGERNYLKVIK